MRTKTFCLGIAGIVAVLAVSAAAVVWCLPEERYMDREYPGWMQQRDAARAEGTEPEAVILGDSRVKIGAWPKFLAEDVQNLALTGGTPLELSGTNGVFSLSRRGPAPQCESRDLATGWR